MNTHKPNCPGCTDDIDDCEHHELVEWIEGLVGATQMQTRKQVETGDRIANALEALVKATESIDGQLSTIEFTIRDQGESNRHRLTMIETAIALIDNLKVSVL